MTLLSLLKGRFEQAKKFTEKKYIEDVKRAKEDYEENSESLKVPGLNDVNQRYEFPTFLIFTNVEAMKASLWDRLPDLIIKGRGAKDEEKRRKVNAAYEYLKDKLDMESLAFDASHWFVLGGFVSATGGFKSETYEAPVFNDDGSPALDEMGQPIMQTVYSYNDPVLELDDPEKTYFSPEAKFSIDAKGVPFHFRWDYMTLEDIKRIYGVEFDADSELEIEGYQGKEAEKSDIERAKVYFYYGTLPEDIKSDPDFKKLKLSWESGANYYLLYTKEKLLYGERREEGYCRLARWYSNPSNFFGFGMGKVGRSFQKEKSIRRGQAIRYADVAAYPKLALKNDGANNVDVQKLTDPREQVVVTYESEAPTYLVAPDLSSAVVNADKAVDEDAQRAFGLMDISTGAQQSSTVDTATGQSIFSEAAERRVRQAKKLFMKWYLQVVIMVLKLAQAYWDETKLVTIMDEDGSEQEVEVSKDDLKDIDFDKDIELDTESATYNKDIVREQMIAMYDKVKDDPLVNRRNVIADTFRDGFDKRNPERYIKQLDVAPGTVLTDPTGAQFTVNEAGDVVSVQNQMEMATPSNDPTASNQANLAGSIVG